MKKSIGLLSAFALFGGMNQTGLTSNPVPYTGVPSGADPPKRMSPEEVKAEFERRYKAFLRDIDEANLRRLALSSKARRGLKEFKIFEDIVILARTPKKAEQIFRKALAENNLTLEKKKDENPTEIPDADPTASGGG